MFHTCEHISHEACFYEYIREFESQKCPACDATLGLSAGSGVDMNLGTLRNIFLGTASSRDASKILQEAAQTFRQHVT